MLAYRHAFHAGNHADVLKHLVFAEVLRHMAAKDKPFTVVDTHAGAGGYSLESRYAQRNAEATTGIERLWPRDDLPAALARYVDLVRAFNGGGQLEQYPGSPAIANLLLRPTDPLHCFELLPTDERILRAYLRDRTHAKVTLSDGFAALAHELPPPSRRGVVLIDPPYESQLEEFDTAIHGLRDSLARWPQACYVLWYPIKLRRALQPFYRRAATLPAKSVLIAELLVRPDDSPLHMNGSGLLVVNAPYQLDAKLRPALQALAKVLGDRQPQARLEWLKTDD